MNDGDVFVDWIDLHATDICVEVVGGSAGAVPGPALSFSVTFVGGPSCTFVLDRDVLAGLAATLTHGGPGASVGEPADILPEVLRTIDPSDVDVAKRVVELQHAAYRIEADLIGFNAIPPLHETVDDVQGQPLYWRGSFEDQILAGIIGWTVVDGVCDIDRLAIHPNFARRGHGRKLVSYLTDHRTITVSTGTKNLPARQLYEKFGFVRTGEREIASGAMVTTYERKT